MGVEASAAAAAQPIPDVPAATLREVAERLAPLERAPCSPGEREAALWIAQRLEEAGARDVALEEEPSWGPWPPTMTALAAANTAATALSASGRRASGALVALGAAAGILDEIQNGPRLLRRAVRRRRATANVHAWAGDPGAARTLVVLSHHDAAQTGAMFDQSLFQAIDRRWPGSLQRFRTQLPQWWLGFVPPALAVWSALSGRRGAAAAAVPLALVGTALAADIARNRTVPGANDNLSAVALIVALAEMLRERPLEGLRVMLVSCGAEETLQDGIRAFMARHRGELDPGGTWFLNPDTVGSPRLILLRGEGPAWMEPYTDPSFGDLVVRCARRAGVELEDGFRARASTDSVIPSRAGYPTAGLCSLTRWQAPANYHLPSDTPANLDYGTVAGATRLVYAVAGALAAGER